jgi:hypothetical protein
MNLMRIAIAALLVGSVFLGGCSSGQTYAAEPRLQPRLYGQGQYSDDYAQPDSAPPPSSSDYAPPDTGNQPGSPKDPWDRRRARIQSIIIEFKRRGLELGGVFPYRLRQSFLSQPPSIHQNRSCV